MMVAAAFICFLFAIWSFAVSVYGRMNKMNVPDFIPIFSGLLTIAGALFMIADKLYMIYLAISHLR
jgi:hypothetical protein